MRAPDPLRRLVMASDMRSIELGSPVSRRIGSIRRTGTTKGSPRPVRVEKDWYGTAPTRPRPRT